MRAQKLYEKLLSGSRNIRFDELCSLAKALTLITRSPEIKGGNPRIAGTGVTLQRVVGRYKLGLKPEDISREVGHITVGQVHAALAYYDAHHEEIENFLAEENSDYQVLASRAEPVNSLLGTGRTHPKRGQDVISELVRERISEDQERDASL